MTAFRHPNGDPDAERLLAFNRGLLGQALDLAAAHERPGAPAYERPVGAHLRHVIEHYEALLLAEPGESVDYDNRPRDAALQASPRLARGRLLALQQCLSSPCAIDLGRPVTLRGQAGLVGEFAFEVSSSVGRELVFVASHAVHHYALLVAHAQQHGIVLPSGFGIAPSTVAYQRAAAAINTPRTEEFA